jgi:hypothetical protein
MAVTAEATPTAAATNGGAKTPIIPIEVKTAKKPPAGVKAPYIHDWKVAASVPCGAECRELIHGSRPGKLTKHNTRWSKTDNERDCENDPKHDKPDNDKGPHF